MSQIIVTSRYLKSGSAKNTVKRKNYTKYIATRETVEIRVQKYDLNAQAAENQKKLLNELLTDFPESKRYLEYEDYVSQPTAQNASELISTIIECNADVIGNRQNFVGYIAKRPGAEQRGAHGLFSESDKPIVLNQVADEVAHHSGNVWSHVVSLRREDAVRLGYDNSDRWCELVMRHISDIAEAQKIPLCNMKWYAAFHDTTHHPHIHLIVYSTNPKQGYLTKEGIDKIRSVFANDIFHDELRSIYQEQTLRRNELKVLSENQMSEIANQIQNGSFTNKNLEKMVMTLRNQLKSVSGKKVYGYLPKEIKETVDRIFSELAENPQIVAMYEKWCELERAKYKTYTQKEKDMPPMAHNNVFKPVKNMIIQTVLKMEFSVADIEIKVPVPDADIPQIIEENLFGKYCLKWSDDYKNACKIIKEKSSGISDFQTAERLLLSELKNENVLAMFELGKLYSMEKSGLNDSEKSFEYYQKALQEFLKIEPKAKKIKPYLQYQIAMMYFKGLGTQIDNQKAAEYFEKSIELGNQYAKRLLALEYISGKNFEQNIDKGISLLTDCADSGDAFSCCQLGRLYFFGADGLKKDKEKAMQYLNLSAEQGNEYAQNLLDNQEKFENEVLADTVFNLFVNLSRCIEDDYNRSQKNMRSVADSRLRRMIRRKKEELGIKEENGQTQGQSY